VGGPTYWIGDNGKGIDKVNWQGKKENMLDGEDLCAAQVAQANGKLLMWGWIPMNWNGGDWGGHLSLPHEVFALKDGTLGSRLEKTVSEKIRGGLLWGLNQEKQLNASNSIVTDNRYSRLDMSVKFSMQKQSCMKFGLTDKAEEEIKVYFNNVNNSVLVNTGKPGDTAGPKLASTTLPKGVMNKPMVVRFVAESDMLEIFINDQWSLCTRLNRQLQDEKVTIAAPAGKVQLEKASLFRLKWLEEIK
jgi:sucrose-6-phosphate hydrolase SacC (GH32 family)